MANCELCGKKNIKSMWLASKSEIKLLYQKEIINDGCNAILCDKCQNKLWNDRNKYQKEHHVYSLQYSMLFM